MVIELVGVPGSGKTWCLDEIAQHLLSAGYEILVQRGTSRLSSEVLAMPRPLRLLLRTWRVLRCRGLALASISRIRTLAQFSEVVRLANRESLNRSIRCLDASVVLVDEGPLHKICAIYAEHSLERPLDLVDVITHPTLCMILEVPDSVAIGRLRRRRLESPVQSLPTSVLRGYLASYRDGVHQLEHRLRSDVMRIDLLGDDDCAMISSSIVDYLKEREG